MVERPEDMTYVSGGQGLRLKGDDYLRFARVFLGTRPFRNAWAEAVRGWSPSRGFRRGQRAHNETGLVADRRSSPESRSWSEIARHRESTPCARYNSIYDQA